MNMEEAQKLALEMVTRQIEKGESLGSLFMCMVRSHRMSPSQWMLLITFLIYVDSQPYQVVESQEEQDTTPPEQTALRQYQLALRCQRERIYSVRQQATSIAGMLRQKPLDWGGTAPKRPLHKEALPVLPWRVRHRS